MTHESFVFNLHGNWSTESAKRWLIFVYLTILTICIWLYYVLFLILMLFVQIHVLINFFIWSRKPLAPQVMTFERGPLRRYNLYIFVTKYCNKRYGKIKLYGVSIKSDKLVIQNTSKSAIYTFVVHQACVISAVVHIETSPMPLMGDNVDLCWTLMFLQFRMWEFLNVTWDILSKDNLFLLWGSRGYCSNNFASSSVICFDRMN